MNRNRKETARKRKKKISKRVFIQCRAFFSCVFFQGQTAFFSITLIRFAEKKMDENLNEKRDIERICEYRPPNEMSGQ